MQDTKEFSPIYKIHESEKNDNRIYVKREDLLPFSLGGNKVRIAREFFNDMETKGCDVMVAYGNSRSNLCRVIANECCIRKVPCYIINSIEEYEEVQADTSNSRLMKILGAQIIPCQKSNIAETVERTMKDIEKNGRKPYYIFGNKYGTGNEAVAAGAYAKVYKEIKEYERINEFEFDYIFHASGTGATQSGLVCGHILEEDRTKIVGILISSRGYARAVSVIADGVADFMNRQGIIGKNYSGEIHLEAKYNKGGYGLYDADIIECIKEQFLESGLPLDPVYTGKAFWGMLQYLKEYEIKEKNILFLHTGGTPLFYDCLNGGELK